MIKHCLLLFAALVFVIPAPAAIVEYYIGRDTRPNIIGGAYDGLPNPNLGRLTMLFAHPSTADPSTNHYHGIGVYSYTGPAASPVIQNFGTNYQIPESYQVMPPLAMNLTAGGLYDERLTLQHNPAVEYSDPHISATPMLSAFAAGSPEAFMYNSSGGRYNGDISTTISALQLISMTPGLHVGSPGQLNIVENPYDTYLLGLGNNIDFEPVFWADAAAPEGNYSARFRIVDVLNNAQPSGEFVLNLRVVPEPGSALLGLIGAAGMLLRRRRN